MRAQDTFIGWTPAVGRLSSWPTAGRITCFPFPDYGGHGMTFAYVYPGSRMLDVSILATERDGLAVETVHAALLEIDEYREAVAFDVRSLLMGRTAQTGTDASST